MKKLFKPSAEYRKKALNAFVKKIYLPVIILMLGSLYLITGVYAAGKRESEPVLSSGNFDGEAADTVIEEPRYQEVIKARVDLINGNELKPEEEKININTASKSELMRLNGIGEVLAGRIIEYREINGPFGAVEDITGVSGIGEKTYLKLSEKISV